MWHSLRYVVVYSLRPMSSWEMARKEPTFTRLETGQHPRTINKLLLPPMMSGHLEPRGGHSISIALHFTCIWELRTKTGTVSEEMETSL